MVANGHGHRQRPPQSHGLSHLVGLFEVEHAIGLRCRQRHLVPDRLRLPSGIAHPQPLWVAEPLRLPHPHELLPPLLHRQPYALCQPSHDPDRVSHWHPQPQPLPLRHALSPPQSLCLPHAHCQSPSVAQPLAHAHCLGQPLPLPKSLPDLVQQSVRQCLLRVALYNRFRAPQRDLQPHRDRQRQPPAQHLLLALRQLLPLPLCNPFCVACAHTYMDALRLSLA
mmetsp:Transcript_136958/g.238065  ORF Transcript_136958/g.238065 Transcript_136958/m.238065 type:complete len:224 (-) Transcript_136958:48-719(-)